MGILQTLAISAEREPARDDDSRNGVVERRSIDPHVGKMERFFLVDDGELPVISDFCLVKQAIAEEISVRQGEVPEMVGH